MRGREERWAEAMRAERRGDAVAYEALLRDIATSMRRIVAMSFRRLGIDASDTEDVVQDILIAVHTRRGQWSADRPLLPWLNAIARYKTVDAMRRLRRHARGRVILTDEEWSTMFVASDSAGHHDAMDLDRLIAALPSSQQSLVRTIGIEGASHRETADRLGTSEGAVRVAFHRSVKKLIAAARGRTGE